jgi:hypothetical protein
MDRDRITYELNTAPWHWSVYQPDTQYAGGKPKPGTPPDRRLSDNRRKPAGKPAARPPAKKK